MWQYNAKVSRVVDGDTLDLRVDLGFTASVDIRVRLYGMDTPEVYGVKKDSEEYKKGMEAHEFVNQWLLKTGTLLDAPVVITSFDGKKLGTGKYGRWLAEVYRDGDSVSLNEALVKAGHAILVSY